ncbi:carbohydrate-binding protein [Clostridium sp. C8-1-8]|uniref:DUF7402 domain-containing protein n=1 Tax=Clostridium sp. C8-1-8 TaxID=2698831 RepID=UPI00136C7E04|nr:carbohydrate-binding protein [Clostridium sp. C8-1-8]
MKLSMEVLDVDQKVIAQVDGEDEVNLVLRHKYQQGDQLVLKCSEKDVFIWLQFDDAMGKSMVLLKDQELRYTIPFGDQRVNLSPKAFYGEVHLLTAKKAEAYDLDFYRNLCLNVYDQNSNNIVCYPHASANVETRGEVVFAARNVIDGVTANLSHGDWPFQSWGINRRDDALLKVDFGRKVKVNRIVLYTRADFPHDNWWEKATFSFSDGSQLDVNMEKSSLPHVFEFEEKQIEWLELGQLIKSLEESPFPALTQLEVYGKDLLDCLE